VVIKLCGHPGDQLEETPEVLQDILVVPYLLIRWIYQKDLMRAS
jgi:hypothetical protein